MAQDNVEPFFSYSIRIGILINRGWSNMKIREYWYMNWFVGFPLHRGDDSGLLFGIVDYNLCQGLSHCIFFSFGNCRVRNSRDSLANVLYYVHDYMSTKRICDCENFSCSLQGCR